MKTASAKAKGRNLCKEIVQEILTMFPELEPDDVKFTSAGVTGEDIQLSPKARKMLPIAIEAKNQEALNFWQAFEQAKTHSKGKYIPVLIARRNRTEPLAVVNMNDFLYLLRMWYEYNETNKK